MPKEKETALRSCVCNKCEYWTMLLVEEGTTIVGETTCSSCSEGTLSVEPLVETKAIGLWVDQTLGKMDFAAGEYFESTADRRKWMKDNNMEAFTGSRTAKEQMKSYKDQESKERREEASRDIDNIIGRNLRR